MSISANLKLYSGASHLMRPSFVFVVVIMAAFCAPRANADFIYTYTGLDFTVAIAPFTTSDSVTGWITTSAPLGDNSYWVGPNWLIIDYTFSDGVDTLDYHSAAPHLSDWIEIWTDAQGQIAYWFVLIQYGCYGPTEEGCTFGLVAHQIEAVNYPPSISGGPVDDGADGVVPPWPAYGLSGVAGTWSETEGSPTPEPSSVGLMSTALLALAFVARKRTARSLPPAPRTIR